MTVSQWVSLFFGLHTLVCSNLPFIYIIQSCYMTRKFLERQKDYPWFYEYLERRIWHDMLRAQPRATYWPRGLSPARLLCPWNLPGKNTGWAAHPCSGAPAKPRGPNLVSCLLHWQAASPPPAPHRSPGCRTHIIKWLLGKWKRAGIFFWDPKPYARKNKITDES